MENLNGAIDNLDEAIDNKSSSVSQNSTDSESLKSSNIYFIISIIIFAFSILATIFLYVSNINIDSKIIEADSKINEFKQNIDKLKNNNQIVAYKIIKDALPGIEKNINNSKVQNYINELTRISRRYKVDYSGFSYQNKKISTSAIVSGINDDVIKKISDFIKDYRVNTDKNVFVLDPVGSISGDSLQRSFEIGFAVK